jgi:glycosyltransferase involved in cell wall biosynthesis
MRILRVSYRIPPSPGGKERHAELLTREQVRAGHDVVMAFRHGHAVPDGARVLPSRPNVWSRTLGARSDVLAFAAEVAGALPDVDLVHLHGDHVEASLLGPACRRRRIPLVLTAHATLARRHRLVRRWALRYVGAFVALGVATAADLVAAGADPARILTMSSGLDLAALDRLPLPPEREPGLVVSVGSLEPMKNHHLLVEAVRRLRATRPGVRLVVAGDGPLRTDLRELAGDWLELPGHLSRDEVYRLVRRAEVFVLASQRLPGKGEGVPTAALEALALGTPVVVSTDASLAPVVPDGAYASFGSGSVDDLVRVLGGVLADDAVRRELGDRGRRAAAALDWPAVAARITDWYGEVAGHRTAARV